MNKMIILDVNYGKPVYDEKNKKLLGWSLTFLVVVDSALFSPFVCSRFFPESWWRNSYKNMLQFRTSLLSQIRQNENNK